MLTTLFYIPTKISLGSTSLPLFGWGAFFFVWLFLGTTACVLTSRQRGYQEAFSSLLLPLVISGAVIVWGLPALDEGHGIPVRGYGTMLIAAAAAGTWLSIFRGRKVGIDADSLLLSDLRFFSLGSSVHESFLLLNTMNSFFARQKPDSIVTCDHQYSCRWSCCLWSFTHRIFGGMVVFPKTKYFNYKACRLHCSGPSYRSFTWANRLFLKWMLLWRAL